MDIGNNLKNLRLKKGLTQEELGRKLNLKKSSISRYESNQQVPELDMLKRIADCFNVSIDYLTSEELEEVSKTEFRYKLRELRKSKGIDTKKITIDLGIHGGTLSNWETGRREPSFDTLIRLAKYFNVTTDYLLGLEEESVVKEITLETEVKALRIIRENLKIAKVSLEDAEINTKSYCAGSVDALKIVLQELIDEL